jgi:hypothetical protein
MVVAPSMNPPPQQQPAVKAQQGSYCADCVAITGYGIFTLILTLTVLLSTIAFAINFSMLSGNVSSQMVVLTGHRTRDWSTANSYSMHPSGEDRLTRLYVCMQSAGIKNPDDPTYSSLGDFRDKAKKKVDCGAESDGGWPRDYGFLRCIQDNYNADFHQSNVFLKCLDLTEGFMVETIQTPASTLFLGSFNFVALLIASMGIMASFLLFTAGGFFTEAGLKTDMIFVQESNEWVPSGYNYVAASQGWAPLAALPMWLALAWSFFLFGASMFYTFPAKNLWSDIVSTDGGSSALPGTPWTGYMCAGTSLMMTVYFSSCLLEWYGDRGERTTTKKALKQSIRDEEGRQTAAAYAAQAAVDAEVAARAAQEAAARAAEEAETANKVRVRGVARAGIFQAANAIRDARAAQEAAQRASITQKPLPVLQRSRPSASSSWAHPPGQAWAGVDSGLWGSGSPPPPPPPRTSSGTVPFQSSGPGSRRPTVLFPRTLFPDPSGAGGAFGSNPPPTRADSWGPGSLSMGLGIRYNTQLHYVDHASSPLTPLLNKAFALTWVFVDSLMFVGMLNGQNSPLNENVVNIWYYILQCRGFQLAAAYFMDDVLFVDKRPAVQSEADVFRRQFPASYASDVSNSGASQPGLVQSNIIHAGIAVACSHLASLWCMVIVLYHFINAISIPLEMNSTGVTNPTCALQIAFVAFHIGMEIARHVIAFMTIIGRIDQANYLTIIQVIYTLDWVIRYAFIVATLFTVPFYLGDNNAKLYSYLLRATV